MPENELRRDPLGANLFSSLLELANDLTMRIKKRIDEYYYDPIPPYRPTNKNWEATFASLGFNQSTIEKFWRLFCQINNCSGAIHLEQFLDYFSLDRTRWTERCFRYFDVSGRGGVDFLEFSIAVWNICTFKIDSLSNFAFDMYDTDSDGELSLPEIERMVNELFGVGGGKQCLKEAIDFAKTRGGVLSLDAFIAFTGNHQLLLFPMFQIQRQLQRKVFGVRYWEKVERRSKEVFNNQDQSKNPRHVHKLLRTYQTGDAVAEIRQNEVLRDGVKNNSGELLSSGSKVGADTEIKKMNSLMESIAQTKASSSLRWRRVKERILNGELGRIEMGKSKVFPVR